jgi:beta-galactosidase GanA
MIMRTLTAALLLAGCTGAALGAPPRIEKQGDAFRLVVRGKPMLMLAGELGNSSASSEAYMAPHWARLRAMHLNTVLAPVSWELIEPREGQFDWSSVDMLIRQARAADLHLVFLWFGAWKNSMSTYVPGWVKRDQARFPRAALPNGQSVEILSAFSPDNLHADAKAYAALVAHIKAVDGERNTVLMVQVENEMGMLPVARDYGPLAEAAFRQPVPSALIDYMVTHRDSLRPPLRRAWEEHGARTAGDWETLFGPGDATAEIFTAWSYARYADAVAAAGQQAYPLPMYANIAFNRVGKAPGEYPSGGPLPHLIDVWKAGAPHLDMLAPDVYFPSFVDLTTTYRRADNPLFIPEANNATTPEVGANAFFAFGSLATMGYSPFSIESIDEDPDNRVGQAYAVLEQLTPALLANEGLGRVIGMKPRVLEDGTVLSAANVQQLGGYEFTTTYVDSPTGKPDAQAAARGGLIIQTGTDEFLVAGTGIIVTFRPIGAGPALAGIDSAWEGTFDAAGRWTAGRLLNGDQTHQGRHVQLEAGRFQIQKVRLYRYQ